MYICVDIHVRYHIQKLELKNLASSLSGTKKTKKKHKKNISEFLPSRLQPITVCDLKKIFVIKDVYLYCVQHGGVGFCRSQLFFLKSESGWLGKQCVIFFHLPRTLSGKFVPTKEKERFLWSDFCIWYLTCISTRMYAIQGYQFNFTFFFLHMKMYNVSGKFKMNSH